MKKIYLIIILVIILFGIAAGGYFFLSKKSASSETIVPREPKFTKLTDEAVISPVVTYDGTGFWYFNSRGQMFRQNFSDGKITEHAFSSLLSLKEAVWPPKGEDFIAISNSKYYFDSKANTYTKLPDNVQSFDWMPDGKRIVYVWKSGDNKSQQLMLANPDASGFIKIADVFWPDLAVKVSPDGKHALLVRTNIQDTNKIYKIDLETGKFETAIDTGRNIGVKWVSATKFLYNQTLDKEFHIKLYDLATGKSTDLELSTSLDEVAVDSAGRYIYASAQVGGSEIIMKIDLQSATKENIYALEQKIFPRKLILNGSNILIINSLDSELYYLQQ